MKHQFIIIWQIQDKNSSCKLLCYHTSAWAWTASPHPGWLKTVCVGKMKVVKSLRTDWRQIWILVSQDESCSHDHPGEHFSGRFFQTLGIGSALLLLSLWDHSPCRSGALLLWSVSIFLTDEFAHYICEAICDSVGTAPVPYPLQCVVLLLAHRNIRLLSLILTCCRFDWTLSRPLESGASLLKTTGYSDFYLSWLFLKMINTSKQHHTGVKTGLYFSSEYQRSLFRLIRRSFRPACCRCSAHPLQQLLSIERKPRVWSLKCIWGAFHTSMGGWGKESCMKPCIDTEQNKNPCPKLCAQHPTYSSKLGFASSWQNRPAVQIPQ